MECCFTWRFKQNIIYKHNWSLIRWGLKNWYQAIDVYYVSLLVLTSNSTSKSDGRWFLFVGLFVAELFCLLSIVSQYLYVDNFILFFSHHCLADKPLAFQSVTVCCHTTSDFLCAILNTPWFHEFYIREHNRIGR